MVRGTFKVSDARDSMSVPARGDCVVCKTELNTVNKREIIHDFEVCIVRIFI